VVGLAPGILHGKMTHDALFWLFNNDRIRGILKYATEVDREFAHCRHSNHRVERYQREFERYGGRVCFFRGAEWQASEFITKAHNSYAIGNRDEADRCLGYAIHFIQDALCPEHIFPFREGFGLGGAHLIFEAYITVGYNSKGWSSFVSNAPVIPIFSPEDLRNAIGQAANWISNFPCSYMRQDGQRVIDPRTGKVPILTGWSMSDKDIGIWMERASSLVKGATIFAAHSLVRNITLAKPGISTLHQHGLSWP